ncbi:hypothetical protein GR702_01215 [Novosphingobium sp. FGD1]|uniref:Uncharacterized protein n=1 Tax=Novosphingobium silvae TaxID=2692619 RepID=A0A7X4GDP4_9SPHN|nr:hypothetical protein [Novosphingobium silvae]MYL96394.1 hypothetical protein [Novosphingobium silvae]
MNTNITGGLSRPKTKTFIHHNAALRAAARIDGAGLLTREDLRHLVAEMVD